MKTNTILIASLLGLTALGGAAVAQDTGYDRKFTMEEQTLNVACSRLARDNEVSAARWLEAVVNAALSG